MEQSKERLDILKKLEEYEKNGWFDRDLEDDPPTKPLDYTKVDYTTKKLSSKIKNKIANTVARNYFDGLIARYVRRQHGVVIGQVTAESIKIQIGQVYPRDEERSMNVKGRDFKTGMPKMVTLTSTEIYEVLRRPARQIADEVLSVMEQTSPELISDISENGITLTGGCAQLWGMDLLLMERTGIACILADDPDSCTAYGAGKSLAWINNMQEGPINIARKRAMRG